VVEGALTSTDGLEGLVVRQDLARGEQVTAIKVGLELPDNERFLSAVVPPGMRAGSVTVAENTMVGGLVVAGDRVDIIILVGSYSDENDPLRAITLLQDVEVLAVAQESQQPITRLDKDGNPIDTDTAGGSLAARPENTDANEDARTVTLAVTPEDAPLLALTQADGASLTVYLSLRPEGDREILPIGPIDLPE
jgi:pilus assembly protein CpaB